MVVKDRSRLSTPRCVRRARRVAHRVAAETGEAGGGQRREKDRPANSSADGGRSQLESRETADPADAKGSEAGVPPLSAPHAPQPACSRPKVRL